MREREREREREKSSLRDKERERCGVTQRESVNLSRIKRQK